MGAKELKEKLHQETDALDDATALKLLHDTASELTKARRADILDGLTDEQVPAFEQIARTSS